MSRNLRPKLLVLMYHNVIDDTRGDPWTRLLRSQMCTYRTFAAHLSYLSSHPRLEFSTPERFAQLGDRPQKKIHVYLTFDDGYRNISEIAPELEKRGIPAGVFINSQAASSGEPTWPGKLLSFLKYRHEQGKAKTSAQAVGKHYSELSARLETWAPEKRDGYLSRLYGGFEFSDAREDGLARALRVLSWKEIRRLAKQGFDVGGHTASHPNLAACDAQRVVSEISDDKNEIEKNLGRRIHSFAIPFGRSQHFDGRTLNAARVAGYDFVFTTVPGTNSPREVNLAIKRAHVGHGTANLKAVVGAL